MIAESVLAATLLKSAPGGMLSDAAAQEVGRLAAAATSAPVENRFMLAVMEEPPPLTSLLPFLLISVR